MLLRDRVHDGAGFRRGGAACTLGARTVPQAVAFDLRGRDGGAMPELDPGRAALKRAGQQHGGQCDGLAG